MQEKEDFSLTPEEVARILKISRNTVYELVKRGELSAFRIGRKLRFDRRDVDAYKALGKKVENTSSMNTVRPIIKSQDAAKGRPFSSTELVVCGQDILLDILARHIEQQAGDMKVWRNQVGSFAGLSALYHDQAQMAGIHLWDGESDSYNLTYVRRLLPGYASVVINLAMRMQGFYVPVGNPKNIHDWADLMRPDIRFVNREKGCGTRVLLDEKFRILGLDRHSINGYENEEPSHLAVASKVARGEADVALGNQKASLQVRGLDFIPLQTERYDLVMKKDDEQEAWFHIALEVIQSDIFRNEVLGLGDYDLSETGQIRQV